MEKNQSTIAERIRNRLAKLTPAERKLADTLMANYPVAGLSSITEFARTGDVSTPTVLRMAKKLGFTGFPQFQAALRYELEARLSDPITKHTRWLPEASAQHVLNRFADAVDDNLRRTLKQLDPKTFDTASELIGDRSRALHVVGGRITHSLADYLHTHLQVVRGNVHMVPASSSLWPHHLLNIANGDVLIVFDVRRYESDLGELARLAHERGARIILFTDQWLSPIAAHADLTFTARIEVPSGWDSAIVTMFLVEAMVAAVEDRLWPEASERMRDLETLFETTRRFKKSR